MGEWSNLEPPSLPEFQGPNPPGPLTRIDYIFDDILAEIVHQEYAKQNKAYTFPTPWSGLTALEVKPDKARRRAFLSKGLRHLHEHLAEYKAEYFLVKRWGQIIYALQDCCAQRAVRRYLLGPYLQQYICHHDTFWAAHKDRAVKYLCDPAGSEYRAVANAIAAGEMPP